MGISVSSIEELKSNHVVRDMIKQAVKGTITQASDYQKEVQNVEIVNTQAHQVGMNYIYTKDNPLLADPETPITFTQTVKATSVVQTNYVFAYTRRNEDNTYIQALSYDLAGISVEDAVDKELPNWYDPVYLIKLLGLTPAEAHFNFDKNGIEYKLTLGEMDIEEYKKKVQQSFDSDNEKRTVKRQWNEKHTESYTYYSSKKKDLEEYTSQLEAITKSDEAKADAVELANVQSQQNDNDNQINAIISQFKTLSIWSAYKIKYILIKDSGTDDYNVELDDETKRLYDEVVGNEIYKSSMADMKQKYREDTKAQLQQQNKWDSKKSDDENLKFISFITYLELYFNTKYNTGLADRYADKFVEFKSKIRSFEGAYSDFQINIAYKGLSDIADA